LEGTLLKMIYTFLLVEVLLILEISSIPWETLAIEGLRPWSLNPLKSNLALDL